MYGVRPQRLGLRPTDRAGDDPGRGQEVDDVGSHPTHAHGAAPVPGRVEPVGQAGIACRDDEAGAAVRFEVGRLAVQRGPDMNVVQRLHPVVVEGDHPVFALRRREFDQQRLILGQIEVRLMPLDLGILELVGLR